jgi:hypothetical protein
MVGCISRYSVILQKYQPIFLTDSGTSNPENITPYSYLVIEHRLEITKHAITVNSTEYGEGVKVG